MKIQWGVEGDENSSFFHDTVNCKRRKLAIRGVMRDELWIGAPMLVKDPFQDFYQSLYKRQRGRKLKTQSIHFHTRFES